MLRQSKPLLHNPLLMVTTFLQLAPTNLHHIHNNKYVSSYLLTYFLSLIISFALSLCLGSLLYSFYPLPPCFTSKDACFIFISLLGSSFFCTTQLWSPSFPLFSSSLNILPILVVSTCSTTTAPVPSTTATDSTTTIASAINTTTTIYHGAHGQCTWSDCDVASGLLSWHAVL